MNKNIDLTKGKILSVLLKLALPIMGTSFIQMFYNMVDMLWVGRLGSGAVAAIGTAGFFSWFGGSFILISKVGAEVGVAQSVGLKDDEGVKKYISNSIIINIILAFVYGIVLIVFRNQIIDFFDLGDEGIVRDAIIYLVIIALGTAFNFINPIFTSIFNGTGDSKTPFIINTVGLVFNIVFDPVLIFGFGPFPALGVAGAAIATVLAQVVVTLIFIYHIFKMNHYYFRFNYFKYWDKEYVYKISKMGFPVAIQNGLFSFFSMVLAKIIAGFGPTPIAVQKVGSQIEAISWMTAGGFSTAIGTFIGQNYGAKKWDRIKKGYIVVMGMAIITGLAATILLVFLGGEIFSLFLPNEDAIRLGETYLKILGYSQLFMCVEITAAGAFNGFGKTTIPSVVSIVFTALRIPLALFLSKSTALGLDGVWWSISLSSFVKGILVTFLFWLLILRPMINNQISKYK